MISHFESTVLFFTHYSIYLTLIFRYLASSGLQLHSFLVETYNIYDYYRINSIIKRKHYIYITKRAVTNYAMQYL
jgi:hypothetical protein